MRSAFCIVVALLSGCAGTLPPAAEASATLEGTPTWVRNLEHNAVVLEAAFQAVEGSQEPEPQKGTGLIVGADADASELTILTVEHVLRQPESKLSRLNLRFTDRAPEDAVGEQLGASEKVLDEIYSISVKLSPAAFSALLPSLVPVKFSSAVAAMQAPDLWLIGRCDGENLAAFPVQGHLERNEGSRLILTADKIVAGCSGSIIGTGAGIVGFVQEAATRSAEITSTEGVLSNLTQLHRTSRTNRNLAEPYAVVAFEAVPDAMYQVDDGSAWRPLLPENRVPAEKRLTLTVRSKGADETAGKELVLAPESTMHCSVEFATTWSRIRHAVWPYTLALGLATGAVGAAFLLVAHDAYQQFPDNPSRGAVDRNHDYLKAGSWTLAAGATLVGLSGLAALSSPLAESELECPAH